VIESREAKISAVRLDTVLRLRSGLHVKIQCHAVLVESDATAGLGAPLIFLLLSVVKMPLELKIIFKNERQDLLYSLAEHRRVLLDG
jgi:hypothetical protein